MTALLSADEGARLRVGERLVIVREAGRCPTCDGEGRTMGYGVTHPCERCNGTGFVAPQAWVALTGPCPTCEGEGRTMGYGVTHPCERCNGTGRWIEPLYTARERVFVQTSARHGHWTSDYPRLVGRGSIEVVPVVGAERAWRIVIDCTEVA